STLGTNMQTFTVGLNPTSVLVTDVTGDGRPDIIVTNGGSNTVTILVNNGNGTNAATFNQLTFATGTNPNAVAVGNVDGTGGLDLVISDGGNAAVGVLLANWTVTSTPAPTYLPHGATRVGRT